MKRVATTTLVLVASLWATGCAGSPSEVDASVASGGPSPTPTAPPSTVPSPTPSPYDVSGLAETLRTALMAPDAFADYGISEPNEDRPGLWRVAAVCDQVIGSESDLVAAHERVWSNDQIFVQSFGYGFEHTAGADVISEVRDNSEECDRYSLDDEEVVRVVLGEHEMRRPARLDDFFAYCETIEESPDYRLCFAFLARANLVAVVVTGRGSAPAAVTSDLETIAALAARALLRA